MAGKRKNKKNGHTHRKKGKNRSKDERAVWARQQQQQAALQTPHAVTPHVNTGPFHNEDIDDVLPPTAASLRSAARKPPPKLDDERLDELLGPPSDDEPPSDDDDAAAADLRLTPEEMESF
eukprot:Sro4741_g354550.1 n/a (120) ;mRNA; r:2-363